MKSLINRSTITRSCQTWVISPMKALPIWAFLFVRKSIKNYVQTHPIQTQHGSHFSTKQVSIWVAQKSWRYDILQLTCYKQNYLSHMEYLELNRHELIGQATRLKPSVNLVVNQSTSKQVGFINFQRKEDVQLSGSSCYDSTWIVLGLPFSTQVRRLARTKSARYVKDAPTRAIFLWGGRSGGVRDLCRSMF